MNLKLYAPINKMFSKMFNRLVSLSYEIEDVISIVCYISIFVHLCKVQRTYSIDKYICKISKVE